MKLRNKQSGKIYDADQITFVIYGGEYGEVEETYLSLDELNQDWEEVKPKEPLIKDEKIRKAVRAWAEAVGEEEAFIVSYNIGYHDCCIRTGNLSSSATIDLGTDLNIKEGSYTIDELCGEE